jgi:hypothetical protein
MKLLGKVDPFLFFLLEMAHAEGARAIPPHVRDCLVAVISRRDNR